MKQLKVVHLATLLFAAIATTELLECHLVFAQTYYVLSSASGKADGTNWNDAFKELPPALVRGATYYIGEGIYGSYTFNDVEAGTRTITIKKATNRDHGTESGWLPSFGDGQAVFDSWMVNTSYWVFDGQVGSFDQRDSYGFRIMPTECMKQNIGITLQARKSSEEMKDISILHVAVTLCGSTYDYRQIGIDAKTTSIEGGAIASNLRIANSYIVGGNVGVRIINTQDSIIENNVFGPNWSSNKNHGGQIVGNAAGGSTENIVVRNNTFLNSQVYVIDFHRRSNAKWQIYNNIIDGGAVVGIYATGDSRYSDVVTNIHVYGNTHKNLSCSGHLSIIYPGTLTNPSTDQSHAYNNLQYNNKNCTFPPTRVSATVSHDYNSYFDHATTLTEGEAPREAHGQISNGNPFKDNSHDSRLRVPTNPALALPPPFDRDFHGRKRGQGSSWSRGATEPQIDTPTPAPLELKVE